MTEEEKTATLETLKRIEKQLTEQESKAPQPRKRRRGLYSKIIVLLCILLAVGYTGVCLLMQWAHGTQPEPQLTIAFFGFITVELWNLAKIKRCKKDTTKEE